MKPSVALRGTGGPRSDISRGDTVDRPGLRRLTSGTDLSAHAAGAVAGRDAAARNRRRR